MEQNNTVHENENPAASGTSEWIKVIVFFGAILIISLLVIGFIAPMIFRDYVPHIVGMDQTETGIMAETDDSDMPEDEEAMTDESAAESADSAEETSSDTGSDSNSDSSDTNSDTDTEASQEAEPLQAEESTSSKIDAAAESTSEETEEEESAEESAEEPVQEQAEEQEPVEEHSIYIVKSGDTLTAIAERNGLTLSQLIAANKSINPNLVKVGQKIKIPK